MTIAGWSAAARPKRRRAARAAGAARIARVDGKDHRDADICTRRVVVRRVDVGEQPSGGPNRATSPASSRPCAGRRPAPPAFSRPASIAPADRVPRACGGSRRAAARRRARVRTHAPSRPARELDQPREQAGVEKRQVAGDDEHAVGAPRRRAPCTMPPSAPASGDDDRRRRAGRGRRSGRRRRATTKIVAGDPLQDVHLSNDDGDGRSTTRRLLSRPPNRRARPPARIAAAVVEVHPRAIMTEARIGRLLGACLHQAIVERCRSGSTSTSTGCDSEGLRDGSIGLAPMTAVLGFLRTEDALSTGVMARAGRLAAEWTVASHAAVRRRRHRLAAAGAARARGAARRGRHRAGRSAV